MAWQTPKTDWAAADGVRDTDMNRIESNISELNSVKATVTDMTTANSNISALQTTTNQMLQVLTATFTVAGWSSTQTNGYYTNQVTVANMKAAYNPYCDLVITSASVAESEREGMGKIIEIETFDGYVIARAIEKPEIALNVRFLGR